MYEENRFTTKQVYDQYGRSRTSNNKKDNISKSASLGGFEPDPVQRTSTTSYTYSQKDRKDKKDKKDKNKGSTYDEVPQVIKTGLGSRIDKPESQKLTGYQKVVEIFNDVMSGFGDFEEPTQPTFDTVKPQNVYKDKRYFAPNIYVPDTSQFGKGYGKKYFLGMELPAGSPKIPRSLKRGNVNIFGNTKDHPRLDMFGVKRRYTRNPDALMAPPSVKMPAKLDPISRALSLAFLPPSMPTTAEYTVSEGESLLTVLDTLNAGKPNSQKVTLEEIGNLNNIPDVVANPFGKIKKGDVLQVPIKKQTAVGDLRDQIEKERSVKRAIIEFERLPESEKKNIRERYRLRKEAQPASYTEEENKILKELEGLDKDVANYVREFFDNQSEERLQKLAEEVGVDIKGKDVSGFGGMGPDPSTGKGIMSLNYDTEELKNVATKEPKQFKITMDEVKDFAKERFDPVQAAAFVATFDAETGGGRAMVEDPYTKADAIKKFVKSNSEIMQKRKAALEKAKNSEEIFNIVYGDDYRTDEYKLGNNLPGDGFTYRGRGPLMITGKTNYKRVGNAIGVDLVNNPDLLATDKDISMKASMAYLSLSGFDDVSSATQLANVVRHSNPKGKEGMRRWKNAGKFYKEMYGTFMPTKKPKARPAGLMEKYTSLRPKLRPER